MFPASLFLVCLLTFFFVLLLGVLLLRGFDYTFLVWDWVDLCCSCRCGSWLIDLYVCIMLNAFVCACVSSWEMFSYNDMIAPSSLLVAGYSYYSCSGGNDIFSYRIFQFYYIYHSMICWCKIFKICELCTPFK